MGRSALIPRWLKWLALCVTVVAVGIFAWELSYRYYFFPREYPIITGDLARQEQAAKQGIVGLYASSRYAHLEAALPRETSPSGLQLVRVMPSGGTSMGRNATSWGRRREAPTGRPITDVR